jgi:hypothetical protein
MPSLVKKASSGTVVVIGRELYYKFGWDRPHQNTRTDLARTTQPKIHDKGQWQLCISLIRWHTSNTET